jgi:hypothetical protein
MTERMKGVLLLLAGPVLLIISSQIPGGNPSGFVKWALTLLGIYLILTGISKVSKGK